MTVTYVWRHVESLDPTTRKRHGIVVQETETRIRVQWAGGRRTWLAKSAEGTRWAVVDAPNGLLARYPSKGHAMPDTDETAIAIPDADPFAVVSFCGRRSGKTSDALAWLRGDPERYMLCADDKATRALAARENLIVEGPVTVNGRALPTVLLRAR